MKTLSRLIPRAVWVVGTMFLAGCWSWRPAELPQGATPHALQVTLRDGSVVSLDHARLLDDTLLVGEGPSSEPVAISVRDVAGVRSRRFDPVKTFFTVVFSLPLVYLGVVIAVFYDGYT